jgi:secreted trypsin-like serine protease
LISGKRLVATGWGVMENVNRSSPGVLQQVCSQFGDSGGLLVRLIVHSNGKTYWQQVGTMSGTVDCGYQTNFPNVYAHVSYYNPWIIDKIRASP